MTHFSHTADCLIIGGGVVGLSLAFELAGRGASVQLLDQASVGRAASWAGAGILPPSPNHGAVDPLDQLRGMSHQLHAKWAAELLALTGIDTGYTRCGGLYLARSAAEAATLTAQQSLWSEHGIEAQRWSVADAIAREPILRELLDPGSSNSATNNSADAAGDVKAIWYMPDECQLRNPRHLKALAVACQLRGVKIIEQAHVDYLDTTNGAVRVTVRDQQFTSPQACICSGAWTRLLMDDMQVPTGILPIRGQMLLYRAEKPLLQRVVNEGHRYLVSRSDGRLLAGSCEEEVGFDCSTTEPMLRQLRNWAERILPQLKSTPLENSWAGLRPGSFDGMPYIGPVPGRPQLFVASGHYRAGLHLSCATAIVAADLMQGKQPAVDLTAFRLGRG